MQPETLKANLADFTAVHEALLRRLHAESGAAERRITRAEWDQTLYRSALHRFGASLPDRQAVAEYLSALQLADLALACALRGGDSQAWEEFVSAYRPVLHGAARAIVRAGDEARARDLADSLFAELYGLHRAGGAQSVAARRPLLGYFHGRSKLSTWLRAVLAQRHVDGLRADRRLEPLESASHPPLHSASRAEAADPDRARLVPRLRQAVDAALDLLPHGDRLLLSLYYAQEMSLAQIARAQGVHEATISRHLERIRRDLRRSAEHALLAGRPAENGAAALPGLSPAELDLCFTYAVEDWGFDLGASAGSAAGIEREGA